MQLLTSCYLGKVSIHSRSLPEEKQAQRSPKADRPAIGGPVVHGMHETGDSMSGASMR